MLDSVCVMYVPVVLDPVFCKFVDNSAWLQIFEEDDVNSSRNARWKMFIGLLLSGQQTSSLGAVVFLRLLPYEVNPVKKTANESHLPKRKKFFMCDFSTFQSGIPSVAISRESSRFQVCTKGKVLHVLSFDCEVLIVLQSCRKVLVTCLNICRESSMPLLSLYKVDTLSWHPCCVCALLITTRCYVWFFLTFLGRFKQVWLLLS